MANVFVAVRVTANGSFRVGEVGKLAKRLPHLHLRVAEFGLQPLSFLTQGLAFADQGLTPRLVFLLGDQLRDLVLPLLHRLGALGQGPAVIIGLYSHGRIRLHQTVHAIGPHSLEIFTHILNI